MSPALRNDAKLSIRYTGAYIGMTTAKMQLHMMVVMSWMSDVAQMMERHVRYSMYLRTGLNMRTGDAISWSVVRIQKMVVNVMYARCSVFSG